MLILTTGKGGVGKTTVAAATALALARCGHRTAVVSLDPAHSLCDVTARRCDESDAALPDVVEISATRELEALWSGAAEWLRGLMLRSDVDPVTAWDAAMMPGLEEVAALLRLSALDDQYDRVVVDCPPTASTLRLLHFPEAVRWYMERYFPTERKLMQWVGPLAERLTGLPMPTDGVFADVERLFHGLIDLRTRMLDPQRCLAQVVTTGQRIVLAESDRAVTWLQLLGIPVSRIVANRVTDHAAIAERFAPLPVTPVADAPAEPVGWIALEAIAAGLLPDHGEFPPPVDSALVMKIEDARATITLQLPEAVQGQTRIGRRGDNLVVESGPLVRHIALPPVIARFGTVKAVRQSGTIVLEFTDGDRAGSPR